MKKLLLALALFLPALFATPTTAIAQCTGVFPSGTACANAEATPKPPKPSLITSLITSGCGSLPNVCARLFGGYSPLWFGSAGTVCAGNGSPVDTPAYIAAQAAARAAGSWIYIPTGTCVIEPNIININWESGGIGGDSHKGSRIVINACAGVGVTMGGSAILPTNSLFLRDVDFEWGTRCTTGTGIYVDYVFGVYINNVKMERAYDCVVLGHDEPTLAQQAGGITFWRSNFSCGNNGIRGYGPAGVFVIGTNFSGYLPSDITQVAPGAGISITKNVDGLWVDTNTVIQTFNVGVDIRPDLGNATEIHLAMQLAANKVAGVRMSPTGAGRVISAYVENGATHFQYPPGGGGSGGPTGPDTYGVIIEDGVTSGYIQDIKIANFNCKILGASCVLVNAAADGVQIIDVQSRDGGSGSPGNYDCIDFNNRGANRVTIANNFCAGADYRNGLGGFGSTTNVVLEPNNFYAVGGSPYGTIGVGSSTRLIFVPFPTATLAGGVLSSTCAANQFGNSISTSGVFSCAQPSLSGLSGTLGADQGGTGHSSYAVGDLLYASAATTLSRLADVATGNALISGGVGVAPSWGKIGLTTHVSGTLPVANGGTGVTSSTGSGSVVLSTSPTLVTPSLGVATGTSFNGITGIATQGDQEAATSLNAVVSPGRQQYHPSAAKAWVRFDGSASSPITPTAAYNVSNVTKSGTGQYTINFGVSFSAGTAYTCTSNSNTDLSIVNIINYASANTSITTRTAAAGYVDPTLVSLECFGDQ